MKKLLGLAISSVLFLGVATTVSAAEDTSKIDDLENKVNKQISEELNSHASENHIDVVFGTPSFKVNEDELENYNIDEIQEAVEEHIEDFKDSLNEYDLRNELVLDEPIFSISSVKKNGSTYTAKVWAGVPGIGHGYINQDFTARVSSGTINSISLKGSSYLSGFTIGSWSHNRSWVTYKNNKKKAELRMKGTLTYGIPKTPLQGSLPATFLKTVKGSGSNVVSD